MTEKPKILVSACLLGVNCRYDGKNGRNEEIVELMKHYDLIPVCPEQLGGLSTPRKPAELRKHCVVTADGDDVTDCYVKGAKESLKLAELYDCQYAVLKERSPSCGYGTVYDGTFTGTKIPGNGVTAKLLTEQGIQVFGESQVEKLKLQIMEEL